MPHTSLAGLQVAHWLSQLQVMSIKRLLMSSLKRSRSKPSAPPKAAAKVVQVVFFGAGAGRLKSAVESSSARFSAKFTPPVSSLHTSVRASKSGSPWSARSEDAAARKSVVVRRSAHADGDPRHPQGGRGRGAGLRRQPQQQRKAASSSSVYSAMFSVCLSTWRMYEGQ